MEVVGRWRDLPSIYASTVAALQAVDGTLAASAHQSHSYTDGACLYFTFAAKTEPDDRDRYYRAAWDAGTRAVLDAGGALSHHHGVGLNRGRFMAEALGPAFEVLVATKDALDPQRHPEPRKARVAVCLRGAGYYVMSILVIDVGTSGLRAAVVRPDATIAVEQHRELLPDTPAPGLVEFDAARMATVALEVARAVLAEGGPVEAVGIANQRASTIVWDRVTGEPVGPALGWQDLRTIGTCLALQADGLGVAPNASATKVAHLLDEADPDRSRDLCVGTVDTWLAWHLSDGALHVTDATNAGVTGLQRGDGTDWDDRMLDALRIDRASLPTVVDSSGILGPADVLDGTPPIASLVGDQQSSLIGQGGVRRGLAKITFGTGGMLDLHLGEERPRFERQGAGGCFPIVAWRRGGVTTWGVEAVMLSAGTNVEWLRDDLGVISTAAESHDVASRCETSDGVVYVPALLGLGTPRWDYGARGTLLGLTRGSERPQIVRAVLEGVAQRGADLVDGGRARHRPRHPVAARRRRDDRQPHVRAGAGRRDPATGGGVAGQGGHDARCGVPGRAGSRDVERLGRRRGDVAATPHRGARRAARPRAMGRAVDRAAEWFPELSSIRF